MRATKKARRRGVLVRPRRATNIAGERQSLDVVSGKRRPFSVKVTAQMVLAAIATHALPNTLALEGSPTEPQLSTGVRNVLTAKPGNRLRSLPSDVQRRTVSIPGANRARPSVKGALLTLKDSISEMPRTGVKDWEPTLSPEAGKRERRREPPQTEGSRP